MVPQDVSTHLQADTITAIQAASDTFANLPVISSSSSDLQTKFLARILAKATKIGSRGNAGASDNRARDISTRSPPAEEMQFLQMPDDSLAFGFSDSGSWDDLLANTGLDHDHDLYLL